MCNHGSGSSSTLRLGLRWDGRGLFGRRAGGKLGKWVRSWMTGFRVTSAPDCVRVLFFFFYMKKLSDKQNRAYLYDHIDPGSEEFHQCATEGNGRIERLRWYENLHGNSGVVDTVANSVFDPTLVLWSHHRLVQW